MRHAGALVIALLFMVSAAAQQPNGTSGMFVQFRQGPPYPIVASAPNGGQLTVTLTGSPGSPFAIASGPLNPGAMLVPAGQHWDLGTPPLLSDVQILADGTSPNAAAWAQISASGITAVSMHVFNNATIAIPPLQAIVMDPMSPVGFTVTAASVITLVPTKSVLFLQGGYDPGVGPTSRLADTSPFGFSTLRDLLIAIGFSAATEVVDTTVTVTPQLLQPHGLLVLGSNAKVFAPGEVNAIEGFVRAGGGLVSYADSTFGPGNVDSDNQVLSRFGLLAAADNFGGPVLATTFLPHPISAGLFLGVRGEGVSIIEVVGNATDTITNVCPCLSNGGACFPYPVVAPSGSLNPTYSACAAVSAGLGRVVATFDRNTFFNWPGYGSNILDASNLSYAVNLFLYAGGY
jgi:hypothetical protein